MGLREQAALDAQAILEDTSSGFGCPFTLTSPLGVAAQRVGFTQDIGQTIDPDTGQAVAGRRASVAVSLRSLPEMPVVTADSDRKPWIVRFLNILGVGTAWKVIEVLPDRALGVVVLLLEVYQQVVVHLSASVLALPRLLLSGSFAPAVALSGALVFPALLLAGELAPAVELGGTLPLPSLQLAGELAPAVELGGTLPLPALQLAGALTPAVDLAGGLVLPSLLLSGELAPAVPLSGALTLPSLQLSGAISPAVTLAGALPLPSLQLAGALTPAVPIAASTLTLPQLQLAGALTPTVPIAASTLTLPSLQLAGALTPAVPIAASTLTLPSLQLAGALTPTVGALAGALVLPSVHLAGTITPTVGTLAGSIVLPSLQLAGTFTVGTSPVSAWLRFASGTVTGHGFSSVPDVLNSNPAVQTVDAARPARVLSANGLPLGDFDGTSGRLQWPLNAAGTGNNGTSATGFMFWLVPDNVTGDQRLITIWIGGSQTDSTRKLIFEKTGAALRLFIRDGAVNPEALTGAVLAIGVPVCVGFEFNGALGTSAAKVVITVNGVAVASTNGAMPTTLTVCAGDLTIGAYGSSLLFDGRMGPNILVLGSAMAGVTSGLLTPAARLALANFEAPT